eukprot:scaffold32335_cov18-Tisochrysis_lutea.AAC.2
MAAFGGHNKCHSVFLSAPVRVKDDDSVRSGKVNPHASSSGGQQEHRALVWLPVEEVDAPLPLSTCEEQEHRELVWLLVAHVKALPLPLSTSTFLSAGNSPRSWLSMPVRCCFWTCMRGGSTNKVSTYDVQQEKEKRCYASQKAECTGNCTGLRKEDALWCAANKSAEQPQGPLGCPHVLRGSFLTRLALYTGLPWEK